MKNMDLEYIDVLDKFGFGLYRTKTGCNVYHDTPAGTFIVNFKGDDFAEMLIDCAKTFDPDVYVSLQIKSHRVVKDIGDMLKSAEKIQILLLKVAIEFMETKKWSVAK